MSSPCAAILKDAVGSDVISQSQAEGLVGLMKNRAKARARSKGGNPMDRLGEIAGEMAMEHNLDIKLKERNALLNLKRRTMADARVDAASIKGLAGDGILSMEIGSTKRFTGGLESTDLRAHVMKKKLEYSLQGAFEQQGIWHEARTGKLDDEIVAAFDNPEAARPEVQKVMKVWESIMEEIVARENRGGANIGYLADWRMPQVWDTWRVRMLGHEAGDTLGNKAKELFGRRGNKALAKSRYLEIHRGKLDEERTFKGIGEDEYLSNVFENTWNDHHDIPGDVDPLDPVVRVQGSLANRVSQPRKLHFKSAKDWWNVHQSIGRQGTITDLMLGAINRHVHNISLLETWGPGGKLNRDRFIQERAMKIKESGDARSAEHIDSLKSPKLEASWNVVSGAAVFSARPMVSKIVDNIKVFTRMSTMGGSGLTAFVTDKAFMQSALERIGMPKLDALGALTRYSMPRTAQEKTFAKMFLVGIEGTTHSIANRFSQDIEVARYMKTADYYFWKANLLEKVTFDHRAAAAEAMSSFAAEHADRSWGDLPEDLRASFDQFGMDSHLWEIYRRHGVGETTRGKFLTEDNFVKIPDSAINSLVEARGMQLTVANRLRVKDEINTAWREWLSGELRFAVPEGTAREQAFWMGNLKRGTWQGELWSMVGLLKTFPVAIVNTIMSRDLYAGGAGRLSEAMFSLNRGYLDVATTAAYATVLGYTSWMIKNALIGRGPPPLTDEEGKPNISTLLTSIARGGGGGILADFLLQEYDTRSRHWSRAAAGPIIGQLDTAFGVGSQLIRGETGGAGRETVNAIVNNTPFVNLFYARWALNHFVLFSLKEALSPGVLDRSRESFEKQGGEMKPLLPVLDPEKRFRAFE